jgi:hypothetical protein
VAKRAQRDNKSAQASEKGRVKFAASNVDVTPVVAAGGARPRARPDAGKGQRRVAGATIGSGAWSGLKCSRGGQMASGVSQITMRVDPSRLRASDHDLFLVRGRASETGRRYKKQYLYFSALGMAKAQTLFEKHEERASRKSVQKRGHAPCRDSQSKQISRLIGGQHEQFFFIGCKFHEDNGT